MVVSYAAFVATSYTFRCSLRIYDSDGTEQYYEQRTGDRTGADFMLGQLPPGSAPTP